METEWGRPLTERHVQALWYDAVWRPRELSADGGVRVRVVDPGTWNLGAGPDFRGAVLEVGRDRLRVTGDVEIHLRPGDWTAHGHGSDGAYADVVAHVTWYEGARPRDLPPRCLAVCLGTSVRTRSDFSPDEIDLGAYPFARLPNSPRPCADRFSGRPDLAVAALRVAGKRRMGVKSRRLVTLFFRRGDPVQVFYEEAFAAFGYGGNAGTFRAIARAIPWRSLPEDGRAAFRALEAAAAFRVLSVRPWRQAGLRPANRPARRLEQAADLFAEGPGLLERLLARDLGDRRGQDAAMGVLRGGTHALGAGRAAALLANVLVPYAFARGRLRRLPDWLVPEDANGVARLSAFRLFGRDHNPALYARNGLLIQGLIQMHREWCLAAHPDCSACGFALDSHEMAECGE